MLNFEEKYIPDETERLKYLLDQYVPLLARDVTPANQKNYKFILKLLEQKPTHTELLEKIGPIFTTADTKPKQFILANDVERNLGPNRSAEYLGLHADISYMVVQHLSKNT